MNITDVHIGLNETSPFMSTNADDSASKTATMDPYYHFNTVLVSKLCQEAYREVGRKGLKFMGLCMGIRTYIYIHTHIHK